MNLSNLTFLVVFPICFALSGCATGPIQLMQEPPDVVNSSDKPPDVVAKCIDSKWEEIRVLGGSNIVDVKNTDAGTRITQRFADNLHFVALVTARGTGSKTQIWTQKAIGMSKQLKDAAGCQ